MDILRCAFNVKSEDLRFAVDFLEEKPRFGVGGTLTIRIGPESCTSASGPASTF
jgi:hypothetical protein